MTINKELLYKLLGQRIKQRRIDLGLNQTNLAEAIGFLRTSITNIEAGRQKPPLHLVYKLCSVLEININELLPELQEITSNDMNETFLPKLTEQNIEVHPRAAQVLEKLKGT